MKHHYKMRHSVLMICFLSIDDYERLKLCSCYIPKIRVFLPLYKPGRLFLLVCRSSEDKHRRKFLKHSLNFFNSLLSLKLAGLGKKNKWMIHVGYTLPADPFTSCRRSSFFLQAKFKSSRKQLEKLMSLILFKQF